MTKAELITLVGDKTYSCVDRGEAVVQLCNDYSVGQIRLATLVSLSESTISRMKACYENLSVEARQLSKDISIHVEACHMLGLQVPYQDQVRLIRLAQEFTKKREAAIPIQKMGPKGRRSQRGLITKKDMQEAIWADKYRVA